MLSNRYAPEGTRIGTAENRECIRSLAGLERAMLQGKILEATALLCDGDLNLHVDLYGLDGIIEKDEVVLARGGETVKDIAILTRVGKPVCFKVLSIDHASSPVRVRLSRRDAQLECVRNYFSSLLCGDIIEARVTHMEPFGAFVDIGCGIPSLLSVDCLSVSRISHPRDRLTCGMLLNVVVKSIDEENERIFVSLRELLGTWEENVAAFEAGQTVAGVIRSIEPYGIFVELAPNLAGLAERKEDSHLLHIAVGQRAAVYIKSIVPDKMKVKLVLIDTYPDDSLPSPPRLFVDTETVTHLDHWRYSPEGAVKTIETVFSPSF